MQFKLRFLEDAYFQPVIAQLIKKVEYDVDNICASKLMKKKIVAALVCNNFSVSTFNDLHWFMLSSVLDDEPEWNEFMMKIESVFVALGEIVQL